MSADQQPPRFSVPDLVIAEREGGYARGRAGYEAIVHAALDLLIEEGYRAISIRKVATRCGLSAGNVSYYFPTREGLVRVLLDAIIRSYESEFDVILHDPALAPTRKLADICTLILEDIGTKKTTRVFPELWALSNHDAFVYERMHELYARARVSLEVLIAEINPALPELDRADLALFMSASMEGMTVFAGHEKPFAARMAQLTRITVAGFVHLAQSYAPGEGAALAKG